MRLLTISTVILAAIIGIWGANAEAGKLSDFLKEKARAKAESKIEKAKLDAKNKALSFVPPSLQKVAVSVLDDSDKKKTKRKGKVVVYGAEYCGVCKKARAFLNRERVRYSYIDVQHNQQGQQQFKGLGGRGVPLILVGNQRMDGFSAGRLQAMLKREGIVK